jgi:protein-S-isoprenylcysteine O-methyltransferase Ste14
MSKRGFLARHQIVRNAIRADVLFFALPALFVFTVGVFFSVWDGWRGIFPTMWGVIVQPRSLLFLPTHSILVLLLVIAGFAIMFLALATLRRNYSSTLVIREDNQLITHGIYRYVRHPIYLGVIMVCFGMPLYASSLRGFLVMAVLVPIILGRITIEERLLEEEFGDEHRTYTKTTRKLIPFVY